MGRTTVETHRAAPCSLKQADMKASTIATAQLQEAQAEIAELTDDVCGVPVGLLLWRRESLGFSGASGRAI